VSGQATEEFYDRSRYAIYRNELAPVIPILEPTIFVARICD
jgi:hypothetical protein